MRIDNPIISGSTEVINSVYFPLDVWSTGGSLINNRWGLGSAGTKDAGLVFGGYSGSVNYPFGACTEEYDGTTWTAGGALNIKRDALAGSGTQNAASAFGGSCYCAPFYSFICLACTEQYNGTTWTVGSSMIIARCDLAGVGTQNVALAFGGTCAYSIVGCTEEYNGTSWEVGGALSVGRCRLSGAGTQDAALAFGGYYPTVSCTEEYNGSTWSTQNPLSTARFALGGAGTQNQSLAFGGGTDYCGPFTKVYSCAEKYDGVSWSVGGTLITPRNFIGGAGSQNEALAAGGILQQTNAYIAATISTCTEEYSGLLNDTATLQLFLSSSYKSSLKGSLDVTGSLTVTETIFATSSYATTASYALSASKAPSDFPYTGSAKICGEINLNSLSAVWSAGGPLITARALLAGAGTQNAALAFGGQGGAYSDTLTCTEEYDGITWTAGGSLIFCRYWPGGAGTQNAALAFGGYGALSCTEQYNGTTWTAGGALSSGRYGLAGAGTQNLGLAFAGFCSSYNNACTATEEYNGSTWTAQCNMICGRHSLAGAGTQNAAFAAGGQTTLTTIPAYKKLSCTEEYNGTSWTAAADLNIKRSFLAGAGTQNAGLAFGGYYNNASPSVLYSTERYDGSIWTIGAPLINGRTSGIAGAGTQNCALAFGGTGASYLNCTEEYTAYDTIPNFKIFESGTNRADLTGTLVTTGSIVINNILTLVPTGSLPTSGAASGSIMTSGSGADLKPYFWNGATWTPLF